MKYIRIFLFILLAVPFGARAAGNDFMAAAQLLAAAKNADIQQVQLLVNNGADINYVDSTGLSLVCTALMNNDLRAAQILQMYGADASQCDKQIKKYNSKNKPKSTGGLFSGLSTTHTLVLAAAGAAVVVGGLLLLTDVFDPDNGNKSDVATGNRPGQDGNTGTGASGAQAAFTVPYGPAFVSDGKIVYSTAAYNKNLDEWSPSADNVRKWDFDFFRPNVEGGKNSYLTDGIKIPVQNYLLMMHGYSSFANGYMGLSTFRDKNRQPEKSLNATGGGAPIGVGLITDNGINPTGSAVRGKITYGLSTAASSETASVDKYGNFLPSVGETLGAEITKFDLSGSGTAMNPFASAYDSALGKIVNGWQADERSYGDFLGFVPYGQLLVLRTGGGYHWVDNNNPTASAPLGSVEKGDTDSTASTVFEAGDTITITVSVQETVDDETVNTNKTYSYVLTDAATAGVSNPTVNVNGTAYSIAPNSNMLVGTCAATDACGTYENIAIYQDADGYYYVNYSGGNRPDAVYAVVDNDIYAQKTYEATDVRTFEALSLARAEVFTTTLANETFKLPILANASLNPESRNAGYTNLNFFDRLVDAGGDGKQLFKEQVNQYYEKDNAAGDSQGQFATDLFTNIYGSSNPAIVIMPAGEYKWGQGANASTNVLDATFENYVPLIYDKGNAHLFMTVVAVQHQVNNKGVGGTDAATSVTGYGNGTGGTYGKLSLAEWTDTDGAIYQSRKCGIAGKGGINLDPWCFAAAGPTAEMATASAAGAVAAVKGAFTYMNDSNIFTLLALTADGPYLGTDSNGVAFTNDTLAAYLKNMYDLPDVSSAQENMWTSEKYLDEFKGYYGYGLINLERAMTPAKSIYFYDGNSIVSTNGNANGYWRMATNTLFRTSSAFSPRTATISAPFYDVLESVDGTMSLPRIWENKFALGTNDARGLYMGDVLGDLKVRDDVSNRVQMGNLGFSLTASQRQYVDNMNGLDTLHLDYQMGDFNMAADYQHYLTDGISRFNGMANPILSLASNAVSTDAVYNMGKWSFGGRAFSGEITDEGLLENDPTVSARFQAGRLGLISGADAHIGYSGKYFGLKSSIGSAHESNTLLGAQTGGLLNLGAGDTLYIDNVLRISPTDNIELNMRSTFARTTSDANGMFIMGLSDIYSNSFAFGADVGNFSLTVAQPLAVYRGGLRYAYADYGVADMGNGKYELVVNDAAVRNISLRPEKRELRFTGSYRHKLGEFTDGALGFVYRINPNNTDEFGNETILMMKMSHRLGI